ncbi:hypothetical protein IAT38_006669 [Cryptococcus sp. DSM 104549]
MSSNASTIPSRADLISSLTSRLGHPPTEREIADERQSIASSISHASRTQSNQTKTSRLEDQVAERTAACDNLESRNAEMAALVEAMERQVADLLSKRG